jgi:hypothetical protein
MRVQNSLNKIKMIKNQLQITAIYMGLTSDVMKLYENLKNIDFF